ncbi:hypothetical protein HPP92_002144 [Vanilla planifolia]|uniref:MATH domain-containing protein n=1 Tax=Vanilla planifolia TaxID=51239 RepID=A0A835VHM3_VANPL|nr:hypothetical protein HPP92_002144 [Vanilla planifolia]
MDKNDSNTEDQLEAKLFCSISFNLLQWRSNGFLGDQEGSKSEVEFEDVHRLGDNQVKHSPEVFYAGSLWKVSIQAFSDEDPQGRRTLGLFLHRRKAEVADALRKVHVYVDSREKVTARYQLICPSKREVMVFGNFKQPGTLLPKAPKGWGWRTALFFDELGDLLQRGALRVAAVVQLV